MGVIDLNPSVLRTAARDMARAIDDLNKVAALIWPGAKRRWRLLAKRMDRLLCGKSAKHQAGGKQH